MPGQSNWSAPGAATNAYPVRSQLGTELWYLASWKTLFGKMNGGRKVKEVSIEFQGGDGAIKFDEGNDSPVWEKDFGKGTGECRFTILENAKGMFTYGDASVKEGAYPEYYHAVAHVIQHDTPKYPIEGAESAHNIYEVIKDLVKERKTSISRVAAEEMDIDAFRAIFHGASRGLLITTDGGKGISLYGGTAGQSRAPYNFYVETPNSTDLVTPSATLATHNTNVHNALAALADNQDFQFDYETHIKASHIISGSSFGSDGVKVGGREYRAIALTDRRNLSRLVQTGGSFSEIVKFAYQRGTDNPALNRLDGIVLDNILYLACEQMEWFRPALSGGAITWGAGLETDPRDGYTNSSKITLTAYLMAGALLRGRRAGINWTGGQDNPPHGKTSSYCLHYQDGWTRNDYFTKDSRTEMKNRSLLVVANYDKGVGTTYAA